MSTVSPEYGALLNHWKKIEILRSTSSLLQWDTETFMPVGSMKLRSEQLSQTSQLEHEWLNDAKFKDAVLSDKVSTSHEHEKRNLELWRKNILISSSFDADFVDRYARLCNDCSAVWRATKADSNFPKIQEIFGDLVKISREHLQRIKENSQLKSYYAHSSIYEVAFDQHEEGFSFPEVEKLLTQLCKSTQEKLPRILEQASKNKKEDTVKRSLITKEFCESLMKDFGFNFNEGRLDASMHPFCGGYPGDIRITVRKNSKDPLEDLLSTLHEVGHALYDQGRPAETQYEPSGKHCSMGVHESQSRFIENFIGRSRAFCQLLSKKLECDGETLYSALNPVKLGFIRVDSDEVTYNLHILLRMEIERDLMEARLEVKDLPERWNTRFKELTGLTVEKNALGCMQDTHWYAGAFGYFPCYSLGNLLAAEIFENFGKEHADWENKIKAGNIHFVRDYMAKKVYPLAAHYKAPECMEKIIGRKVSEKALLNYFDRKFL